MNPRINKFIELIQGDVRGRRLRTALARIRAFSREQQLPEIHAACEGIERRYYYMLRSMAQGMPDPQQSEETSRMLDSAFMLALQAAKLSSQAEGETLGDSYARYASIRGEESIATLAVDYLTEHSVVLSDAAALTDAGRRAPLERLSRDIFHRTWVEYPLDSDSSEALSNLIETGDVPAADREAWIGAVTLGLLEGFDPARIELLARFTQMPETRMRAAALGGLFFALHRWWFMSGSPSIRSAMNTLKADPDFAEDMRTLIFEYSRELGTPALAKRVEAEVLPGLNSLGASLMQRMAGIDLSSKSPEELAELLSGAGLPQMEDGKTRESLFNINRLAEAGDDVFFAFLKPMHAQGFFNDIANWWLPFDTTRSEFSEIFADEGAVLGEMFDKLDFLCDSDKYAVLMAVAAAPKSVRATTLSMMIEQYSMIAEQTGNRDESYDARFRHAAANYMKNAFRFYTLFRRKNEFYNPFVPEVGFNVSSDISALYTTPDAVLPIAERLVSSGVPVFAFPFYLGLIRSGIDLSSKNYFQAAQSAELARYADEAQDWYGKSYELDPANEAALLRRIILLEKRNEHSRVLEILDREGIDKLENPDLLFIYSGELRRARRLEAAQTVLSKIIYSAPQAAADEARLQLGAVMLDDGNPLGTTETCEELLSSQPTPELRKRADFLAGVSLLAGHQRDKAFAAFRRSLGEKPDSGTFEAFGKAIGSYSGTLQEIYGLAPEELTAMEDALRYSFSDSDIPFVE